MKQKDKRTLTPKRRFPEFRGEPGWEEIPLEQIAERVTTKNLDGSIARVLTNSAEHGVVDQRDYFDKDIANAGNLDGYYIVDFGDYVYNPRISTFAPVGPISRNTLGKGVMSPLYTVFRFTDKNTDFYQHYFKTVSWHLYLRRVSSMGARHDRMSITNGDFMAMPVPMPSAKEQSKIADCLSSLDGLIAAEGQKLEALRDHKRGLMQRLFPQPGETQPRLRFQEFKEAGEWEEKTLPELAENLDNKRIPIKESNRINGDVPYYGASGIVDYVRDYLFDEDLLCISEDGANLVARTYPIAFPISGKTWVNNHAHVLRFDKPATQKMVEDYFNFMDLNDFITGMAQPKLNRTMLDTIPIPLPGQEEQQRIAECLSALDAMIARQAGMIDALKAHKRGLMQRLFPAPDEQ